MRLLIPADANHDAGARRGTPSPLVEPFHFQSPVVAAKSYDEVAAKDFDGVVIPGGYAPDHIRRHAKANQLVKDIFNQGKLVASICHGPWVLCSAGVLKGRRATCFFAIKDDVVNAGAKFEDAEVVVDGNLVTSRKPEDLPAFCRASIQVMAEAPVAVGTTTGVPLLQQLRKARCHIVGMAQCRNARVGEHLGRRKIGLLLGHIRIHNGGLRGTEILDRGFDHLAAIVEA